MSGRAFHDWRKAAELGQTIDAVRTSIVTSLSTTDPRAAVARLWQMVDADAKIMERVDDSSGVVSTALMMAIPDLGIAITKAGVDDFEALAEHVHDSFLGNRYGILDRLVTTLAEPLGLNGRADLKRRFAATLANLPPAECDGKRDYDVSSKRAACTEGMMAIADAADDVDGYLAAAEQHPYMRAHVDEAAKRC